MNKRIKKKRAKMLEEKEGEPRLKIMPRVHTPPRIGRPIKGPKHPRDTK